MGWRRSIKSDVVPWTPDSHQNPLVQYTMHGYFTPEDALWLEPLLIVVLGTTVIVGLAVLAERFVVKVALWQRAIWRAVTLSLLVLLAVELTGTGPAFVRLVRLPTALSSPAPTVAPRAVRSQTVTNAEEPPAIDPGHPYSAQGSQSELSGFSDRRHSGAVIFDPASIPASDETGIPALHEEASSFNAGFRTDRAGQHLAGAVFPSLGDGVKGTLPSGAVTNRDVPSGAFTAGVQGSALRLSWVGVLWMVVALALAARVVWARWCLLRFRRRHAVVGNEALRRSVEALARRLGIRRRVVVLEAAHLATPVAFGSFRPTLAIPAAFSRDFEVRQQEAMLAHELAHLSACDPAWQFLADLVCASLWWHPLAWLSRRRLRSLSEVVADEASLLVPDGPQSLAACLVAMGRRLTSMPHPRMGWLAAEGPDFRSNLGRRVERLLAIPPGSFRGGGRMPLTVFNTVLAVVLVFVAVFSTAWVCPRAAYAEGGTTMNVLENSWRHSLAAMTMMALLGPISGDALSQEGHDEKPVVVNDEGELPEGFTIVQEEGRRERAERREHPEAEQRERPDAERRERREAEQRERSERGGGEREILMHQIEVMRAALHALMEANKKDAAEMLENAIRAREVMLEGRKDDEAHMIRERAPKQEQLTEILGLAANLWREFNNQDKAAAVGQLAEELGRPRDREQQREHAEREREPRQDAERREQPHPEAREKFVQEKRELAEHARHLEEQLGALRDDQDEEARELQAMLREVHQRIQGIDRELGEAPREVHQRIQGIDRELGEAPRDRPHEAEEPRHEPAPEQRVRELQEEYRRLEERARDVQVALRELGDDNQEEARALTQEYEEIRRRAEQIKKEFPRERDGRPQQHQPEPDRPDAERRLQHLRAAVENLHAAGLHEQAEALAGQIERVMHGAPERGQHRPEPQPEHREPPRPMELERVVHELNGQVQQMQKHMEEMRHALQMLLEEREEGNDDDDHKDDGDDDDEDDEKDDD